MWYLHKNNFVKSLVCMDKSIWRWDRCSATFRSLNIHIVRVLIDPLRFLILICINDLTLFVYSERLSFSRLVHCQAHSLTESILIFKLCFSSLWIYAHDISAFWLIMLILPVLTWPVGLYKNGGSAIRRFNIKKRHCWDPATRSCSWIVWQQYVWYRYTRS